MFDATNSTAERRKMIHDIVVNKWGYKLFFVESICDDPQIIEQNIMVSAFEMISFRSLALGFVRRNTKKNCFVLHFHRK